MFDLVAIAAQATGFVVWPIVENKPHLWLIPISIFMISMGWWENYISKHSPIPFVKALGKLKQNLDESRYFTYMFVSVWKVICFFIAMLILFLIKDGEVAFLFSNFSDGFSVHPLTIQEVWTASQVKFSIKYFIIDYRLIPSLEERRYLTYPTLYQPVKM